MKFKQYSYQRIDKDFKVVSATKEVMFYKLTALLVSLSLFINIFNFTETETVLKYVKELRTDTFEKIVLVRSSNLVKIEFPRSQNIATSLNNPGCIRPGNPEVDKHAIGVVDTKNGPFLAFMNPEQGFKALSIVINNYKKHSIKDMISKYAPSFENNTDDYIANVCKKLKCKPISLVKDVDSKLLAQVIAEIEGYKR